jgi:ATP-dependent helicase HrpB
MVRLPIDEVLPEVVQRLRESRALVLVAEPGAGKTTRVPPAVLRAGLLPKENPNIVMLQPRRVAARAAAQRIAEENGWELGREVGYQIRFEKRMTAQTRLRVMTEGILTRQLIDDPFLSGVGAVILDEFHERSLHTDLAAALLREIRRSVREDLILIVMSATLEAEPIARFLGDCAILRAPGRTFPVTTQYVSTPLGAAQRSLEDRAADQVAQMLPSCAGDVLVFMPGAEEIRRTMQAMEGLGGGEELLVLPLHGSLSGEEQIAALRPSKRRKIIVATNIAETSLTIEGVRIVIDSGVARVAAYDPRRGLDRLELKRISKASATQRAGRAGRTAPGICVRLWPEREQLLLADFEVPEIRRVDLASTVLMLHAWGVDPRRFGWYEPPEERTIAAAESLLAMLGALSDESNGKITELGRRMLALPLHPRLARLLVEAGDAGMIEEGAMIAAILSEKDVLHVRRGGDHNKEQGDSDLAVRMEAVNRAAQVGFREYLYDEGIDVHVARQVLRVRDELIRVADRGTGSKRERGSAKEETRVGNPCHGRLILAAYPDRVCRRRETDPTSATMVGGGGVRLGRESVVHRAAFFVAVEARQDERSPTRQAIVRIASAIEPAWLEEMFPREVRREQGAIFDEQTQKVQGVSRVWYRDLLLREDRGVAVDPEVAATVLAEALRPRALEIFESDESAAGVLARVALLRQHMGEHAWPAFDDVELAGILAELAVGKRSLDDLRHADLAGALKARLPYPLDRLLEQHAPTTLAVPSGSSIRIQYSVNQPPVLAARLQELFGWMDTPRIAGGRVPVTLHLLGPNYRPAQITQDLRSFWQTTYYQVRKDLRAQYPKHSWPEDPLTAKAEAKGKRRPPV